MNWTAQRTFSAQPAHGRSQARDQTGFTLVELLTVLAIIAVLATLFLTTLAAAKKKARIAVCTANLHQFSLAVNMYLDESDGHPPTVDTLVSRKYLANPRSLVCPEDRIGNWGRRVVGASSSGVIATVPLALTGLNGIQSSPVVLPGGGAAPVPYSYLLHPLSWPEWAWARLMEEGSSAGLGACQLHGLGAQDRFRASLFDFEGLLLRAQRDGAVVRRRVFWGEYSFRTAVALPGTPPSTEGLVLTPMSTSPAPSAANPGAAYPWPIYMDVQTNVLSLTNP